MSTLPNTEHPMIPLVRIGQVGRFRRERRIVDVAFGLFISQRQTRLFLAAIICLLQMYEDRDAFEDRGAWYTIYDTE
jgi:hypothetical protein